MHHEHSRAEPYRWRAKIATRSDAPVADGSARRECLGEMNGQARGTKSRRQRRAVGFMELR